MSLPDLGPSLHLHMCRCGDTSSLVLNIGDRCVPQTEGHDCDGYCVNVKVIPPACQSRTVGHPEAKVPRARCSEAKFKVYLLTAGSSDQTTFSLVEALRIPLDGAGRSADKPRPPIPGPPTSCGASEGDSSVIHSLEEHSPVIPSPLTLAITWKGDGVSRTIRPRCEQAVRDALKFRNATTQNLIFVSVLMRGPPHHKSGRDYRSHDIGRHLTANFQTQEMVDRGTHIAAHVYLTEGGFAVTRVDWFEERVND